VNRGAGGYYPSAAVCFEGTAVRLTRKLRSKMSTKSKFSRLHVPPTQRALGPREPQEPVMGISDINSPVNTANMASKLGGNIPGSSPGARSNPSRRSDAGHTACDAQHRAHAMIW
jgi:hypothetical protein